MHANCPPRAIIVGYFGQWAVYQHFFVKDLVRSGAAAQLDQLNYAQGSVTGARCGIADPNADLNMSFAAPDSVSGEADQATSSFRGNLHQLAELKARHPHLRVLISLEGRAADFATAAQPENRAAFVQSCVDTFIRGRFPGSAGADHAGLFDGIDLDWEYPHAEDAANFVALLSELRKAMDSIRPGLRLAIAVSPSPAMYPNIDMALVGRLVDQIGIMNYDYNGPWSQKTGFLAPLYSNGEGEGVDESIRAYEDAGVPAAKLLMGMPFYAYGWREVGNDRHGLYQQGRAIRGDRPYSFIEGLTGSVHELPNAPARATIQASPQSPSGADAVPFIVYRDPASQAPWLYDGQTFWTYEDPTSIRFKAAFALKRRLGGIMAWELSQDSSDAALLKAARSTLEATPND